MLILSAIASPRLDAPLAEGRCSQELRASSSSLVHDINQSPPE